MYHSRKLMYKEPFGAVPAGQSVTFSVYPERRIGANEVTLWMQADGQPEMAYPMRWHGMVGAKDRFTISLSQQQTGLYWYWFTYAAIDGPHCINRGYGGQGEISDTVVEKYQLTVYDPAYHPPAWFGRGITYNIFPDRFARDAAPVQPEGEGLSPRVLHESWEDGPAFRPNEQGEILNNDFFGGTLRGVMEKLDYLESLHVKTLYFNPMFQAFSNHRYDTGDYKKIDPLFGCEEDFAALCRKAKRRGMRVVLDGVFNHTGYDSRYFNARGTYDTVGAHQSKESPYYSWYDFQNWPDQYSSWWGIYTLPQTNEMHPDYLGYIIEEEDSVIRRWLRLGASGWRLDVADELPDAFIAALNRAAKQEKKDALVIGEVWEDASNKIAYSERRRYLHGGELDSVMNYPLRDAILAFLKGGTAEHFVESMESLRENYPREVFYSLMNFVGTHDTPRALTVLGAEQEDWNRSREEKAVYRLSPERYAAAVRRLKLAAVIQFCMPGSPTMYYGDEVGMQGFEDPFNRGTFPWGKEDRELLAFFRYLTGVRIGSETLSTGELRFHASRGSLLHFERTSDHANIQVLVNRGYKEERVPVHAIYALDLLSGKEYTAENSHGLTIQVPPEVALILRCGGLTKEG